MGYALFAAQKINYSNLIFNYQMQLNEISEQRLQLTEFIANISDGNVSMDEILSDPTNTSSYLAYMEDCNSYIDENISGNEERGIAAAPLENAAESYYGENYTSEQLAQIESAYRQSYANEYSKYYQKQLEVEDQKLESKQKKIETKLTAAQKQLEAVEQAEGNAINSATPKYAGIG